MTPKTRPRFNRKTGTAYTDKKYKDYLEMAAEIVALRHRGDPLEGQIQVSIAISEAGVVVDYREDTVEPSFRPRWDLDNAVGAILDALQKGGAISNDRNVAIIDAWRE